MRTRNARYRFEVREGDAANQIVRFADAERANTIIVGARGHGALMRMLLGSVSEHVVKHAHCHVVVARGMFEGDIHL